MNGIQLLSAALLDDLVARARASPRLRTNHNFHRDAADNPHRFLNVMIEGTYVRPHRHVTPPKAESFVVLRGAIAVFLFDEQGTVVARYDLAATGEHPCGIDVAPGIYHSIVVTSAVAIVYEVKPGPYQAESDKAFAPFAPPEGSPDCASYLAHLAAVPPSPCEPA